MPGRRTLKALTWTLAAGLPAATLVAQTTGALTGRVLTRQGAPVPGAVVRLSGANLQGVRVATADANGNYRFALLTPGRCQLLATHEGMNPAKVEVVVGLDKTATVDLTLVPVATATVEVVSEVDNPVDLKSTTAGATYTSETFLQLPTTRDFGNIATLAPGITQDREGIKVYGSTGVENNYIVDGINTTQVEFGKQGKKIPVEFIQEFQVKTGGYEAEYGKSTGGVVNVLTKSGGNEFTGDLFYYLESKGLQASNKHSGDTLGGFKPLPAGYRNADYGFDVGGYFIKDKLWFFLAYDRTEYDRQDLINAQSASGATASQRSRTDLFAGKLTWRIDESQNLVASFIGDPAKVTGAVKDPLGPQSTWDGIQKVGGTDLSLRYEITGQTWFGEFQVSRHKETNSILPGASGADLPQLQHLDGSLTGGFGRWDKKDFTRDNVGGSLTRVLEFHGQHELKAGFDLQKDVADVSRNYSGGQFVVEQVGGVYSHQYWTSPDATADPWYAPVITFSAQPRHFSRAYFLQDKWSPNARLTLNLGVRYDKTEIEDQFGATRMNLAHEWAPRLGFIYDWRGKGQDKVYASLSRFYEQVPMDLVIRSFSSEINPAVLNYSPTDINPDPRAGQSVLRGSYIEPVDYDVKGEYVDQFILGMETTLRDRYVVGAKFIRHYLGRVIEDALDVDSPNGDFFIMNPGFSQTGKKYPRATRDFRGVELDFQRKFADHFTYQLSYLWSELVGNYEGGYSGVGYYGGTGQTDPNINAAFDEPGFVVNSYGPLSGDRKHQFKANGYYEFTNGLTLGASAFYFSGTPVSRLGNADQVDPYYSGRYEVFVAPRGSDGRTPDTYQVDLSLAYSLKMARKSTLRFMLNVTNLLDSQPAVALDQRYNLSGSDAGQGNPHYRMPIAFQAPRSIRLGVRYSF